MKIKKIEWRNFNSYGNRNHSIKFDDEAKLYQIVGHNGAGKSTISEVIIFGLYGKIDGKTLKEIPNRINGNAWVKILLEAKNSEIIIERGLAPDFLKVTIDGVLYDSADKRSIQEHLTNNILGIPMSVFTNTIIISINDFKSFVKMAPKDKRAIMDRIFGFQIFNDIIAEIKKERNEIKTNLDISVGKLDGLISMIKSSNNEMETLLLNIEKNSKDENLKINEELKTFESLKILHLNKKQKFNLEYQNFLENMRKSFNTLSEIRAKKKEIENKIILYKDYGECPTCGSILSNEFFKNIKTKLSQDLIDIELLENETEEEYNKKKEKEIEYSLINSEFLSKEHKIKEKIYSLNSTLKDLISNKKENQLSSIKNIINKLTEDKENIIIENSKLENELRILNLMDEIMGDGGVKKIAMKNILNQLNDEIANLLIDMEIPHKIIFDYELNSKIYHFGSEISPQTLSTGEMKKVDFVVLVSILKIMKAQKNSTNVLFLDELFSSVDINGTTEILKILRDVSKKMNLNILVMNHAPIPHELFDLKLEVNKINNFSSITIGDF